MNILAVDDDPRVRKVLEPMLMFWDHPKQVEYCTYFACHGLEAVQWVEQHGVPEMLLLDVRMPLMNGAEFLQHAHQQQWDIKNKVLLLTGYADDLEHHIGSDASEMLHLRKPFTMHELHQCLDALVLKTFTSR